MNREFKIATKAALAHVAYFARTQSRRGCHLHHRRPQHLPTGFARRPPVRALRALRSAVGSRVKGSGGQKQTVH